MNCYLYEKFHIADVINFTAKNHAVYIMHLVYIFKMNNTNQNKYMHLQQINNRSYPGKMDTIVDFQKENLNKKIEDKKEKLRLAEKKVAEIKNRPITRERNEMRKEVTRDESDMQNGVSITQRIQRKEEEAIGKSDTKTFTQLLEELSDKPDNVLMDASTVFPYRIFPETIIIDPVKVKIITRYFFHSKEIKTVLIKDILETSVEMSPLLATLQIVVNHKKDQPLRINHLKKETAEKAAKIIQGLVIARSESPDISKVEAIR